MAGVKCFNCGSENLKSRKGYETIKRCEDCGRNNQVKKSYE